MTVFVFVSVLLGGSSAAWAKANGIASGGCLGCPKAATPKVTITVEPMVPEPGASSVVSVHISDTDGNYGGFYLSSNKKGTFSLMGGPVKLVSATEAVHSSPQVGNG